MKKLKYLVLINLILYTLSCANPDATNISDVTYHKWDLVTIDFEGPILSEQGNDNPFMDYRLNVKFRHKRKEITVPGYFAADGNAAETSAKSGTVWRVKFRPELEGKWTYKVSFRKGEDIAIAADENAGIPLSFDGQHGSFEVIAPNPLDTFTSKGRLAYAGMRYLQFQESKDYFLKGGPNSPENFLTFKDFDDTYPNDTSKNFIKSYIPHLQDWKPGDPSWQSGKGKGIIGALNYIADKGMNTVYFLTMNITADGDDVWPYVSPDTFDRFDCSKLDQWEIVFQHAQNRGIMLHFLTQETENETLLDTGDTGRFRKVYYRELVARFSHHLMITWNLGEENGYASFTPIAQYDRQRKDMATYLKSIDPYNNYTVIHTHAWKSARDSIVDSLYQFPYLDGLSLQIDKRAMVHEETKRYIQKSKESGRIWVSPMDEIGMYWMGAMPDAIDPDHDTLRTEVLWGHLMAGGPGVEWYFGYKFPPADLDCEDWRSREKLWEQTKIALDIFQNKLPFHEMESHDELVYQKNAYCLAKPGSIYAIYYKSPRSIVQLKVPYSGKYELEYIEPKTGAQIHPIQYQDTDSNIVTTHWPKDMDYNEPDMLVIVKFME